MLNLRTDFREDVLDHDELSDWNLTEFDKGDTSERQPMPPDLQAVYIAAVQADASEDYHIIERNGQYVAVNPAQGLEAIFAPEGVQIHKQSDPAASWQMALARCGYGDNLTLIPDAELVVSDNRVEYRRGHLTEWYVNGPLGLEQGFTLHTPPAGKREGESLILELSLITDLNALMSGDRQNLSLVNHRNSSVFQVGQLYVNDDQGRRLDASIDASDQRIRIIVDDQDVTYPIIIDPLIQTEKAKLTASDGASNDRFGYALALEGDTALIGAYQDDSAKGAAYVFVRSGTTWSQQAKLTASDGAANDLFGFILALDGDSALIGAYGDDTSRGAAYVFVRSGSTWSQQAKLTASDGAANHRFGYTLALEGDNALIGAYQGNGGKGAAYVFVRSGTTWSQQAKLTDDGTENGDHRFGYALALEGDNALIGAYLDNSGKGSAYVFVRSGSTWSQQAKLTASDGAADDGFGYALALEGDNALIGAYQDDSSKGAAYVFVRSGTTWSQQAKLTASDGTANDSFGYFLVLEGDTALIGAPSLVPSAGKTGAAYVFVRSGTTWSQQAKLTASDGAANDWFGYALALEGDTALVGAHGKSTNTGAAYLFTRSGTIWSQQAKLTASDAATNDNLGYALALDNSTVLVGAYGKNSSAGAAYVFGTPPRNTGSAEYPLAWSGELYHDDAINIRNGEKTEQVTDLDVNTPVGALAFTRTYRQNKRSVFQFMGLGWTHNQASTLFQDSGDPDILIVEMPGGGELYLKKASTNHYVAFDGSDAVIDFDSGSSTYTLTATDKSTFVFNASGQLTSRSWPGGETWSYTYTSGKLTSISDGYGRGLQLTYISNPGQFNDGQLWRVGDHNATGLSDGSPAGRYVEFSYVKQKNNGVDVSGGKALLSTVRDVRGNTWTYKYYGQVGGQSNADQLDFMIEILSPAVDTTGDGTPDGSISLESLAYTTSGVNVTGITRSLGNAALSTSYAFQPGGAENTTTEVTAGRTITHAFANGVYSSTVDPAGNLTTQVVNNKYRPEVITDGNQNPTNMEWSTDGKLLKKVSDAQGNETSFEYVTSGASKDSLDYSLDAQGRKTQFTYGDSNHPQRPTSVQIYDTDGTTLLHAQEWVYDSQGRVRFERLLDTAVSSLVREVEREYYTSGNGNGLLWKLTQKDLLNAANNIVTTYFYDSIGRVVKTTQNTLVGNCQTSYTVYDAANNVVASICNYDPGGSPDPTTAAEAVALFNPAFPDKNRVTTYVYDTLGRLVKTTADDGASYALAMLTAYDSMSRVVRAITNYVASASIPDPYVHLHSDFTHGPNNDQNLVVTYNYNERGLLRRQRDVLSNLAYFGYDSADRLVRTIQNASQQSYNITYATGDPSLGGYAGNFALDNPDQDIITTNEYDAANNLIRATDSIGNVTLMAYDKLNRPIKVIRSASQPKYDLRVDPILQNYVPGIANDQDLIEVTEYDVLGRVIRRQDVMGNWTLFGYDGLGRAVKTVRSASQPTYNLKIDPTLRNYVASTASDQDLITEMTYDPAGRTMFTADELGRKDWTAYDGLWRVTKRIDIAVGTAIDNGVNDPRSPSYALSQASDQDQMSLIEYDSSRRVWRTRDPLGNWTLFGYDSRDRQVRVIRNASKYGYDATSDPSLSLYTPAVGAASDQDVITQTVYDAQGRVSATIDANGNETRYTYDALGRTLKTVGNFVTGTFNPAFPDRDLTGTSTYDLAGRVVSAVDTRGTQTTIGYDIAGRQRTVTRAAGTTLATTDYTCYDKAGRVLRTIRNWVKTASDPSPDARNLDGTFAFAPSSHGANNDQNLITTLTLDKTGRTLSVSNPVGNTGSMSYDKDGQLESTTDPLNVVTKYRYDKARRRILTVQGFVANGEDPALWKWNGSAWTKSDGSTAIAFGTAKDQNLIMQVEYDKAGRKLAMRDPRGNRTTYTYDQLDRRISLTNPLNHVWSTTYINLPDGATRVEMTNPLTHVTRHAIDRLGRVARIHYSGQSQILTPAITFAYDKLGNRLSMVEKGLNFDSFTPIRNTFYTYDQANRLIRVDYDTNADGTIDDTVNYEYDAGGLKTRLTMPGSLSVVYTYNARGQLVSLTDWSSQTTNYTYDGVDRLLTQTGNNLLSAYSYDPASRLSLLRHTANNRTLGHFAYTVNARGDRTQAYEGVPRSTTGSTTLAYNDPSIEYYLGTWTDAAPFKTSTSTNAALRLAYMNNQATLTMGTGPDHGIYDIYINNVFNQTVDGYAVSTGEQAINLTLGDEGPHVLEVRNTGTKNASSSGFKVRYKTLVTPVSARLYDLQTTLYSYDAQARLSNASLYPGINTPGAATRSYGYSYDVANNRTQQVVTIGGSPTTTNYTYDAANRLISDGTNTYTYDNAGRMTSDGVNTYTWDRADRLLTRTGYSYGYNGLGQRVRQQTGGQLTNYLIDMQCSFWKVLAATTGANTTRYLHGPRGLQQQRKPNNSWNWFVHDALGSVRGALDASLNPLESRDYAPYGEPTQLSGSSQTPYGYTGEPTDSNSLVHLRNRYMNPALGQFISLDKLETFNRYAYVGGNPINRTDPTGFVFLADPGGGGGTSPQPMPKSPTPVVKATPPKTPVAPPPAPPKVDAPYQPPPASPPTTKAGTPQPTSPKVTPALGSKTSGISPVTPALGTKAKAGDIASPGIGVVTGTKVKEASQVRTPSSPTKGALPDDALLVPLPVDEVRFRPPCTWPYIAVAFFVTGVGLHRARFEGLHRRTDIPEDDPAPDTIPPEDYTWLFINWCPTSRCSWMAFVNLSDEGWPSQVNSVYVTASGSVDSLRVQCVGTIGPIPPPYEPSLDGNGIPPANEPPVPI